VFNTPLAKGARRKYLCHMARKAAWEDLADADMGPYARKRGTSWGRVFIGVLLIASATFVAAYYVPLYRAHQRLSEQYHELGQRSQGLSDSVTKAQQELKSATEQRDRLQSEHDQTVSSKKADGDRLERLQSALSSKLDKLVKKGSAAVAVHDGALVVAFDAASLFLPQKLDLSPTGRQLLCDTVKSGEAKAVTVRASLAEGAAAPPALAKIYPAPWVLSAARAAAIVQGLQDTCAIPAAQLSATGLASRSAPPGLKVSGDRVELELGR
jgi:chemotaxis protein MotB